MSTLTLLWNRHYSLKCLVDIWRTWPLVLELQLVGPNYTLFVVRLPITDS